MLLREIALRYATGERNFVTSVYIDLRHGDPQSDDEARQLVAEALFEPLAARGMAFGPKALPELIDQTGGVPVLVSAVLRLLYDGSDSDTKITFEEVQAAAETVITDQRELLDALWEDCTAEMKTDLADLTGRDLRASEVPEHRLIRLERRGFVRKAGKKIRSSCRLMNRFASGEASEVGGLQRLFDEHARFGHNIRDLLEMRLAQVPVVDEALRGYVEQAIRHLHPEPRHTIVWVRSIVDRALDLVWQKELKDGTILPDSWMKEWERAGIRNTPDDGAGRLPGERGRQLRVLRYAAGTGLRGQTVRRVTRHVTRPTALLLEHLQAVGNFGQHQDDDVDRPFAVTVCLTSITLCHCLARDLLD